MLRGGFASPQMGDFGIASQLMNLQIKEESTASRHQESSYVSPEDFKDGSSYDSRYFSKSLGGFSNNGSKQSEHRLKEKRSIFRAFKSFYGKGIYLDPESHMKRYRYYTKNKLNEYDLSHSTLFNNYIELFTGEQIRELNKRIKLCQLMRPQATQEILSSPEYSIINEVCYH